MTSEEAINVMKSLTHTYSTSSTTEDIDTKARRFKKVVQHLFTGELQKHAVCVKDNKIMSR